MARDRLVQSVVRATEFLKTVSATEEGLTLQQLSQETGLKLPTVHNLVSTLVSLGLLEKSRQPKRYRLGPSLLHMVDQYWHNATFQRAEQAVKELAVAMPDAIVTFAQHRAGDVVIVLKVAPHVPQIVQRPKGLVLAPYSSVSALIYQAYWDPIDLLEFRRHYPFEEYARTHWLTPADLEAYLEGVRRQGHAHYVDEVPPGSRVGAPVFDRHCQLIGVLGAYTYEDDDSGPAVTRDEMVQAVVAAARRASTLE